MTRDEVSVAAGVAVDQPHSAPRVAGAGVCPTTHGMFDASATQSEGGQEQTRDGATNATDSWHLALARWLADVAKDASSS